MNAPDFYQLSEGRYLLKSGPLSFDVDRVRLDRHELIGELAVRVFTDAAPDGIIISRSDFNLSSQAARQSRAKFLTERGNVNGFDVYGAIESLCQQVLQAEQQGQPAVHL
jgi:hypothetical protein